MRRFPLLAIACCTVSLAACGGGDAASTDTAMGDTAGMAPMAPMTATLSLADIAGRWNMRSVPETGDTTPTTWVLAATADTAGWTITFPNREPLPMRVVAVDGDSVVTEVGPYESARRRGVQTNTRSVLRMAGDSLVGTSVAHYATNGADTVLTLRTAGTRAP